MGTFHDNLGELHGITVVVRTDEPKTYVGRCHEATDEKVLLHDADEHADGDNGQSTEQYLTTAARWGVFAKHKNLLLPGNRVVSITRLSDLRVG